MPALDNAHQTVIRSAYRGVREVLEFGPLQYSIFCSLTRPDRRKCASSLKKTSALGGRFSTKASQALFRESKSRVLSYCITVNLFVCMDEILGLHEEFVLLCDHKYWEQLNVCVQIACGFQNRRLPYLPDVVWSPGGFWGFYLSYKLPVPRNVSTYWAIDFRSGPEGAIWILFFFF